MKALLFVTIALAGAHTLGRAAEPPRPLPPVPSPRQLAWQSMEFNAFIHFGINTFTDREWGTGTEDPVLFNPTGLDCRQWARVCKEAGMKGIILTAKHHDGFCLWPSKYTEHSVKNSPWRAGKGDVVRELSEACRGFGLKMGIYLSPWDRHEPSYGDSPRYNEHYKNQLRELLTDYGPIFEVWFDGACGEGPNGKRQVYDWPGFFSVVRECQPQAVIFSDAGPDVRWVGNEKGIAGETNWSLLRREEIYPGYDEPEELTQGHIDGKHWVPAEADVSIRPGWFYHPSEDGQVKSLETLVDIYFGSVGRNAVLLLNLPVDRRGLIPEEDVKHLMALRRYLDTAFAENLAEGASATASNVRGDDPRFGPQNAVDGEAQTYWCTEDDVESASLVVDLGRRVWFNCILLQEQISLGQRVAAFSVAAWDGGNWQTLARGTTIGYKRLIRIPAVTTTRVRLNLEKLRACPAISNLGLFRVPPVSRL